MLIRYFRGSKEGIDLVRTANVGPATTGRVSRARCSASHCATTLFGQHPDPTWTPDIARVTPVARCGIRAWKCRNNDSSKEHFAYKGHTSSRGRVGRRHAPRRARRRRRAYRPSSSASLRPNSNTSLTMAFASPLTLLAGILIDSSPGKLSPSRSPSKPRKNRGGGRKSLWRTRSTEAALSLER